MIRPKKVRLLSILLLLWLISMPFVTSSATVFRARDNVFIPEHQIIDDDLFLGGNNIKVDGTVKGDLIVGSRTFIQTGQVSGSVISAGQNLDILGEIQGSVRALSQNTNINGVINRNVINIGASLNIRHTGKVKGDVTALGNELNVEGEIGRKLRATVGSVMISGIIKGDVKIKANSITLMPTARINGDFIYKSEKKAKIEPGALIAGETEWTKLKCEEEEKKGFFNTSNVIIRSLLLLACIVTGLFLILIANKYVQAAEKNVFDSFLKSLGLGFILMICIPVAIVVFLATVIGIPIALITLFVYLVLFYISKIFVGIAVGEKILTGFAKDKVAPLGWSLILGLIILTILTNLPYIGWIFYIVIVFTGFGAAILARKELVS
jgi:cytoskeletal protein CcmA (bactofilin family)